MNKKESLNKIKIILAWIGIGILVALIGCSIQSFSPHIMDDFDDNYTGRGLAGFIILVVEFFLILFLGKVPLSMIIGLSALISLAGIYMSFLFATPIQDDQKKSSSSVENFDRKRITSNVLKVKDAILPNEPEAKEHSNSEKSDSDLKQVVVSQTLKFGGNYLKKRFQKAAENKPS